MVKIFDEKEDIIGTQQLKSSAQKGIRAKIQEQFALLEHYMNDVLPKKENFKLLKYRVELITDAEGNVAFTKPRDIPYNPSLRLFHKYLFMMPHQQIMCAGSRSPGAKMTDDVPKDAVVAMMAEGKQHALTIGLMRTSTEEICSVNNVIVFPCPLNFTFFKQQSIHYEEMWLHTTSNSA